MTEEHRTPVGYVTVESKVRKNITISEDLFDAFTDLKRDGETHGMLLQRMINSMHGFDDQSSRSCGCRQHCRSRRKDRHSGCQEL